MKRLDPRQGPRAALYAHFRRFARPTFTLCGRVEVGPVLRRAREEGVGPFAAMLRQVLLAAHAVPELRRRIVVEDGEEWVVEHDRVDCTATVLRDDGAFDFCYVPHHPDRARFLAGVAERVGRARAGRGLDLDQEGRHDLLYVSCLPWIELTSVQHAESGDPLDCVPRIVWGRIDGGAVTVCVTAHHALVDGVHVARFLQALGQDDTPSPASATAIQ